MPSGSLRTVQFQIRTHLVILDHSNEVYLIMIRMPMQLLALHYRRQMQARCGVTTANGGTNHEMYHLMSRFFESAENNIWAQDNRNIEKMVQGRGAQIRVAVVTAFCTMVPNICGPSLCELLHVTILAPIILR